MNNEEEKDDTVTKQGIEGLIQALQTSRGRTELQLARLEQKLDQLSRDLTLAESEIRKELQTQFVTKAEYEPRHHILEVQNESFTRHIDNAQQKWREIAVMRVEVSQLQEDYKTLDERQRGATTRALPWIAIVLTFLGTLYQVLQHIQFR